MGKLIIVILWVFGSLSLVAQNDVFERVQSRSIGEGQVSIRQSPGVERMMKDYLQSNRSASGVEGYRIQLYSGTGNNSKQEAQEVRSKLLGLFPEENVFVEYNAPFMRVRVGSFRHKHEALPLLRKLKSSFPSCYIVRDASIPLREF